MIENMIYTHRLTFVERAPLTDVTVVNRAGPRTERETEQKGLICAL